MGTEEGPSILCPRASLPRPPHFPPPAWLGAEHPGTLAPPKPGIVPVSAEGTQSHHPGPLALAKATHKMRCCPCGPCTPPPVSHLLLMQHGMVHDLGLLLLLQELDRWGIRLLLNVGELPVQDMGQRGWGRLGWE